MRADVLPVVSSILPARVRTLGVCAALVALACTAFGLLAPAGAFAASPLAAGPLNVSAGTAQDGRIATGYHHTCAIKTDGTPVCWGADNPAVNSGQTAVPAGLGPVTQITAGGYHTCAIKTDGTPVCWGRNGEGQTTVPAGIGTVTQITAGGFHTCAIKTDGTPTCWGNNTAGQATVPAGTGTVTQITTGSYHTCAIKTDGTPTCWGNNENGQATIPAGTGTVTQITAGLAHTCAIKTDGTPTCWGINSNGQATIPTGIGTVTQITAGFTFTCAIKTDGTPTCWGSNGYGQSTLPAGTGTVSIPQVTTGQLSSHTCAVRADGTGVCWGDNGDGRATVPAGTGTVRQISVGAWHTCAIKTDGTPVCWGSNSSGQSNAPANITVTQIAAGRFHTCAIKTDGTPICWGNNTAGQASLPADIGTVTQISPGNSTTCAIKTDGTAVCWGNSAFGQGNAPAGTFTQITGAETHTCAIKTDGTPTCWGSNGNDRATVPAGTGTVTQITAGYQHTCAIKTDGTPICWGSNGNDRATVPAGTATLTQIAAGYQHTCAMRTNGTPTCWGENSGGQSAVVITNAPPAWLGAGVINVQLTTTPFPGRFAIVSGSLPNGLTLTADGRINGFPLVNGQSATVTITPSADGIPPAENKTFTIAVDYDAPSTSDNVPAAWQNGPVTVTLTATDTGGSGVKTTTYEIIDTAGTPGTTKTYDPANKPTLNNGEKIRYRSVDNAGNSEVSKTSGAAKVDTAEPTTTDDVPTTWQNTPVTVTLTASDTGGSGVKTTTYKIIDAGSIESAPRTYDPSDKPVLRDGERIVYESTDEAGNVEGPKLSAVAKVDTAKPTTSDNVPAAWQNGPVTVTLTASDTGGSGVKTTTYEIVSAAGTPGATKTYDAANKPTLGNGEKIRYRSTDEAGNVELDKTSAAAKVDTAKPTTSDNVPAAWQNGPVTVTLTASDTGGSDVKTTTYEIIDTAGAAGTTKTYDPANKPTLNNGEKIRYRTTDDAGNTEADKTSAAAKVDTAKPTTSDNVPTSWQNSPVTVTLTASDTGGSGVKTTTYEVIDTAGTPGTTKTYDPANKPTLGDGEKIRYRTTDDAGNVEADKTSAAAKVDTAKPTTTDNVPAAWQNSPVTVTLTATDTGGSGVTTTYEIVNAAGTPGATKTYDAANKPTLNNGEKIRYRSTDEAGNTEADKTSAAAKVDSNAPSTTDNVPTAWQNAPVTVTLTASDTGGSGVKTTTYEIIDTAGAAGTTKTYDAANKPVLSNGEKIRYRSQSTAGTTEADKTSSAAKVDTAKPTTTDNVPAAWQNSPVTVTLTASDTGGSGVKTTTYEIIDTAGTPGATKTYDAANKPTLANGEKIRYRTTDDAGNTEADKTSSAAKIDTAKPTTTDNVPAGFVNAPVTVTLTASDTGGSGVKTTTYEIVNAAGTPGTTKTYDPANKPALSNGEKIRYRTTDEAGNTEADKTSAAAKVDTTAPSTTDNVPTAWQNGPVTVTLTATDTGGSGVKTTTYEIIDTAGTPGATKTYDPANKPTLNNGEKVRYRSQSNAGTAEADKTSAAAKVDTATPSTTDDVPTAFRSGPVTVTLTATDTGGSGVKDTTFEIIDAIGNPGPTRAYDPAAKPTLNDGEKIRYRSNDTAGNTEATKTSAAAKVDAKVPTTTITTAPAVSSAERSPTVAFTSDGVDATYECSTDDAPFAACTSPVALGPLADGQHTFRVRATSRAGLTGPITAVAFTIAQPVVSTPAAATPPAAAVPVPTLQLLGGGASPQILLNKRWISIRVSCGPVPCTLQIKGALLAKNATRVTLPAQTVTLAAGQTRTLRLATTKPQRRIIRRLVGRRGTGGQARFSLRATTPDGTTSTTTVLIGLRRLTNR